MAHSTAVHAHAVCKLIYAYRYAVYRCNLNGHWFLSIASNDLEQACRHANYLDEKLGVQTMVVDLWDGA